jgi:hypothetical protein
MHFAPGLQWRVASVIWSRPFQGGGLSRAPLPPSPFRLPPSYPPPFPPSPFPNSGGPPPPPRIPDELLASDPDNLPPRSRLFIVVPKAADAQVIQVSERPA